MHFYENSLLQGRRHTAWTREAGVKNVVQTDTFTASELFKRSLKF